MSVRITIEWADTGYDWEHQTFLISGVYLAFMDLNWHIHSISERKDYRIFGRCHKLLIEMIDGYNVIYNILHLTQAFYKTFLLKFTVESILHQSICTSCQFDQH